LIETKIHDAVREFYKENAAFAHFINTIKPEKLHAIANFCLEKVKEDNKETIDAQLFKTLLDEDLCIALQNLCQAQKREHHSKEYIDALLKEKGFSDSKILKRYVIRKNIRKFIAPFHYYFNNQYSKLFYGDGWVDSIFQKL